jgi:glycine betaine catabolism A
MPDTIPTSLASLVARRRPGHSLEAPFYRSPEVFAADLDIIFGRHWIYVGVEPDVPEPGDTMVVDVGQSSVLVLRDDDMQVRAFHNLCRHRGARLVHEAKASVGNLVCRYHQWTYGLDGKLLFAPHMGGDFDGGCYGLKPVHLRSVAGLLFICLAAEPPADIDDMARAILPYVAPHDLPGCKIVKEIDLVEHGNWKLTMENNRECYHCAHSHPELTVPLFEYGFGFAPDQLDDAGREQVRRYDEVTRDLEARCDRLGLPSRVLEHLDDRVTGFRTQRLPIDQSGESHTMDTRVASRKLLGAFTETRLGGLHLWTQPNSWHHFMSDHIVTFSVIPLEPEKTLLRTKWLVHKDAVEGVDYDIANLTSVWIATNEQDGTLVGYAQSGIRSPAYEPGPYSPYTEGLVEKFCAWYVGRLAAHLG